jgi:glycosyltransferase involved in cell wall biosynthesis
VTPPAVSVVIPTIDRVGLMERCLTGLETEQGVPFEVIVVHDGAPAMTDLLDRWMDRLPNLRPVRISERRTCAKRNAGWRSARADVIAFTDDDCQPTAGWLAAGLAAMGPDTDMVQGKVLPHPADDGERGVFARTVTVDGPSYDFPNANLIYRRSALERVGGYDEVGFWGAGEDADMAWRVLESGGSFTYAEDALVYHAVRAATFTQHIKSLPRWANLALLVKRHPQHRDHFEGRVFWKRAHTTALLAIVGLVGSLVDKRAIVLVAPHFVRRIREMGGKRRGIQQAAADIVETGVMIAGSVRYRTPLL